MDGEAGALTPELERVLASAWSLLAGGARDPSGSMSRAVLATRGIDDLPNARTVLLWRVDAAQRTLYIHTDVRSPKFAELRRTPQALLVFYDGATRTQLRVRASTRLRLDDELTRAAWSELPADIRRVFATPRPPGEGAAGPVSGPETTQDAAAQAAGSANFVLIEARVDRIDWLCFEPRGHRRAAFAWDAAGRVAAT